MAHAVLCRSDDLRDLRRRKKSALLPVYVVGALVVVLAAALSWVRLPYIGPWTVWARPAGTPSLLTDLPPFGDVRAVPDGALATGKWAPGAHRSADGAWEPALLLRRAPVLVAARQFRPLVAQRAAQDGAAWTAFVPDVRPGDLPRSAPDWRCVGTWTLFEEPAEGEEAPAPRRVVLSSVGDVEGGGEGAAWGVFDDSIVIDRPDDAGDAGIDVGVLSDDRREFVGRRTRRDGASRVVRGRRE